MPAPRILVIGAGMAGLTAARRLSSSGLAVTVLDKGRAPGGRMATRTVGDDRYDHGAQHFGARTEAFRAEVAGWLDQGVTRTWFTADNRNPDGTPNTRYVGVGGMRRIPEHLAVGLDVRLGVTVARIDQTDELSAVTDTGEMVAGSAVILTPPVPQTVTILRASNIALPARVASELSAVEYNACLAVIAKLDGPSGMPDGHRSPGEGGIAWMADNRDKGASPQPTVTIQSNPEFAAAHLEEEPDQWIPRLVDEATPLLASPIIDALGHRWRFSEPRTTFTTGAVALESAPVVLAGEVFAGAKVEGAFISGVVAAERVMDVL